MCRRFNSAPRHPGRAFRGRGATGRAAQGRRVERLVAPRPRTARRCASAIETPSRANGALRRVPIGSSCFCERGGAPFHTFPPVTRAANHRFAAVVFCAFRERRSSFRPASLPDRATKRASPTEKKRGDGLEPGRGPLSRTGGRSPVLIGSGPVQGPPDAARRRSKLPCAPAAHGGEFRWGVAVL